jgi:DNA-directed RNA polymerase specialized sigma24 family protein
MPSADLRSGRVMVGNENATQEIDEIPSSRWIAENVQTSARAEELLAQLPQDVAAAAWLVFGLEFSIIEAGRIMKKSRFSVARSLNRARRAA